MNFQVCPLWQRTILDDVYLNKDEIYIKAALFTLKKAFVDVICIVPNSRNYTARPIPYVTTENYVRCLSQTSYLLAEYALRNNLVKIETPVEAFLEAAANYELYYRNLAITFHERVERDHEFPLRLRLENTRQINRLDKDFILFTFANERTVISGEMSFVYASQKEVKSE